MRSTVSIPATMQAGMYFGPTDVRAVEQPVPVIGSKEVLVSVKVCGICGSDTLRWYREPQARARGGINTGHEISAEIVQVGEEVSQYRPGQRVVITHHFPCLECAACRDGNETSCEAMHRKHIDPGGFSEYLKVMESGLTLGLYPMPDSTSYEEGSFVEPLGCVVRSLRKSPALDRHEVLVVGSGLAGLLHIRLARALGARHICAVDTNKERLEAAAASGASETRLASEPLPKADRIYICTGSIAAASQALDAVRPGGHIMFFASDGPDQKLSIPLTRFWTTQPSILFSYGAAPRDLTEALDHIAARRVRVDDLITHRFPLSRIGEAFELFDNPRGTTLKIVIEPQS